MARFSHTMNMRYKGCVIVVLFCVLLIRAESSTVEVIHRPGEKGADSSVKNAIKQNVDNQEHLSKANSKESIQNFAGNEQSDPGKKSQLKAGKDAQQTPRQQRSQPNLDDPNQAWDEWDETPELKRRRPAKRVRGVQPGMDIHAIMAQMDKKEKIYTADIGDMIQNFEQGKILVDKWSRMLAAGGVLANLYWVQDNRQVVIRCSSVRDAFVSKDFFLRQPEVLKITLDGMPHTPLPKPKDEDEDDESDEKTEL